MKAGFTWDRSVPKPQLKRRDHWRRIIIGGQTLMLATALRAAEAPVIDIDVFGGKQLVPISLNGFTGEAESVLRFDLEVVGFKIVTPEAAQYNVSGSSTPNVSGAVTDRISKANVMPAHGYSGVPVRAQAHAMADDIVLAITKRKGIAQTKIAYKVDTGRSSEIAIADYDGHNSQTITRDGSVVAAPTWLPGQRLLYYTSYKLGNPDIYSHDLSSGERKIIARYSGLNTSAALSPDGRHLALIMSKGGSPDVYVANADGSNLKQLTKTREDESSPCWSPDCRTICFATKINGRRLLARIPIEGGEIHPLRTDLVSNPSEPDWSPDGKAIIFTAQMGGFEICIVPAEGGKAELLASGEDPNWAPNSRTVIFTRRLKNGRRLLSLLDVPTKQVKDISQVSGSSSQPSWAK